MDNEARAGVSQPVRTAWRWLVPSLTQWIWLVLFVVLLAEPQRTKLVSNDGDACMHWRLGETMLQTREILRTEIFSHTRYGDPYVTKEWLSQILYAIAGRMRGLTGLSILAAIVIATTFALLHRQLVRTGADVVVATVVVLIAIWASLPHWHARPHVFSFLLLLAWNQSLRRHEKGGSAVRLAASLAALTLLWVNVHGYYLAGFIVLGCYWLGAAIESIFSSDQEVRATGRRKLVTLSGVGLLCGLVSLANPNGYVLHLHNLSFVRSEYFLDLIDEYSSVDFHLSKSRGLLAWLALSVYAFVVCRPKVSASSALLVMFWTYYALYAERNISILVIVTAPILATIITEHLRSGRFVRWDGFCRRVGEIHRTSHGWPVVAAVAIAIVVLLPLPVQIPSARWPVQAIQHVRAHPGQFEGRMFNDLLWGGYLLKMLPEHRVFIDARFDFYRDALVKDFEEVNRLRPGWHRVLDQYQVTWTLLPARHPLNELLRLSPDWQREHSDGTASIYRRELSPKLEGRRAVSD